MTTISKKVSVIGTFLLAAFLLSATYWLVNSNREKEQQIQNLQQQNDALKKDRKQISNNYDRLLEKYNALFKEKNGSANEALLTAANELFGALYTYDTGKKSDSVAARKEKAKKAANVKTLDKLFSKDAEKITPSVATVSRLEGTPEVYRMSSDDEQLTALVLVRYSLSIVGSKKQTGEFMYKISFNPFTHQIIDTKNIGELTIT